MTRWSRASARALFAHPNIELLGVLVLWFAVAFAFASAQEIWVDETTQLSGLALGPGEVVAWLTGHSPNRFDVPADRMPPVSYWIGGFWAALFGASEGSLRTLGVLVVGGAAAFVVAAARRMFGPRAGLISGVAFVLSPNVIVAAAEIRAYPLLLLCAAVAFFLLVRVSEDGAAHRVPLWAALSVTCIVACYTHFFGLVLSGAVFLGALTIGAVRRHARRAWLAGGLAIAVTALGLWPFARAAQALGESEESKSLAASAARLLYRTAGGHPAAAVYDPVIATALLCAVSALALAVLGRPRKVVAPALFVALGSGFLVALAARATTGAFDALSASYNLWMLPAVFIAMGALARAPSKAALAVAGLLWASNAAATSVLLEHRSAFAHTAARRTVDRIIEHGPSDLVVVHEPSGSWGHGYFPLSYRFGKELKQFLAEPEHAGGFRLRALPNATHAITLADLGSPRVLVLSAQHQGASEIRAYIREGRAPSLPDTGVAAALARAGYTEERSETMVALVSAKLVWMQKPAPARAMR